MVGVIHRLGGLPLASVDITAPPVAMQPVALLIYFSIVGLIFFAATHISRQDLASLPQRARRRHQTAADDHRYSGLPGCRRVGAHFLRIAHTPGNRTKVLLTVHCECAIFHTSGKSLIHALGALPWIAVPYISTKRR